MEDFLVNDLLPQGNIKKRLGSQSCPQSTFRVVDVAVPAYKIDGG
jgi:hypothetical protein